MKKPVCVCWFRRDLRLNDNTGLYHALKSGLPVVPVFIFDRCILDKLENRNDRRIIFIYQCLAELNKELTRYGSALHVFHGDVLECWKKITTEFAVTGVFTNEDYEPYARSRDALIADFLAKNGSSFHSFKDQVIFNPAEVLKSDGTPYVIYTPYKNKWRSMLNAFYLKSFPSENYTDHFLKTPPCTIVSLKQLGFIGEDVHFPKAETGRTLLKKYADQRDFPFLHGTSRIGLYLRFGTVSIRDLVSRALHVSETWVNELIWREFYMMILFHFPYVLTGAFKPAYNYIKWRNRETEFEKWMLGQTGYPIVDAGMRELHATGYMHNRVRMITAGFLTKHLLIDWKWGEACFASKLLDFELASNNGGWQWAAGTGCDAAPYFRIFNPWEQTKKFDPQFEYIRKWVPEFEDFSYPRPIVDHKMARERGLKTYRQGLIGTYASNHE